MLLPQGKGGPPVSSSVFWCFIAYSFIGYCLEKIYAAAIRALPRIRGGRDAIARVRELAAPLGCLDDLDGFSFSV